MDAFKLEPRPDEGDTNNSETLEQAVRDHQAFAQHNKFCTFPVPNGTKNTKRSANNDAPGFRALVLIGVAAALHAALTPHMTESSVESKLVEQASQPVAIPPQWLPVLLANAPASTPNSPPAPPCTDNGLGNTTGRGDWPPLPLDPSSVQCVNASTQWDARVVCHYKGLKNVGDSDEFYDKCHEVYKDNTCYPPGDSKFGCIQDAVSAE